MLWFTYCYTHKNSITNALVKSLSTIASHLLPSICGGNPLRCRAQGYTHSLFKYRHTIWVVFTLWQNNDIIGLKWGRASMNFTTIYVVIHYVLLIYIQNKEKDLRKTLCCVCEREEIEKGWREEYKLWCQHLRYYWGSKCSVVWFVLKEVGAMTSDTSSSASLMYFSALNSRGRKSWSQTDWLHLTTVKTDSFHHKRHLYGHNLHEIVRPI